ncbi:MAG: TonB-dependent receptor [Muribaculaceae bacterium]|nr:TonB-dependent receptor [Muribaculaceae bacterium]
MRKILSFFLMAATAMIAAAAPTGVKGVILDARSGAPIGDASVLLSDQGIMVTTDAQGQFQISNAQSGTDVLQVIAFGYDDLYQDIDILKDIVKNVGELRLSVSGYDGQALNSDSFIFDEEQIADDESAVQSVGTIQGATDDIFYQAASYQYSTVRYRLRGLNSNWQNGYINGVEYNDLMRGSFNFSGLGGMTSSAFRSKSTEIGLASSAYGFGSIGGSQNFTTYASQYAPGFRGNVSYTNSNYMLRAMLQYSSGLNKHGWAFSASVIGRYAPEGVIAGTWYNSLGYQFAVQKVFNDAHSINLTTWGSPTSRAGNNAATQEAYDLAGSNLYNPSWGYLNGKKISDRVYNTFDPSVMVNWLWKPKMGTTLNTAIAFRHNAYARSSFDWYQAADPRPNYYRNLPSYFLPTAVYDPNDPLSEESQLYLAQQEEYDYIYDLWKNDVNTRQIDWAGIYQANLLNREYFDRDPQWTGRSSYILKNEHTNQTVWMLNSYLNHRISDILTLQGGVSLNYTNAHYYETVKDLLGGEYWIDVDNFSERDFAGDQDKLQNDVRYPNRKVYEGDIYGYNYNIHAVRAHAWLQNEWNTRHWNVNYAAEISNTNFVREGQMQNGRFQDSSLGKGKSHNFVNAAIKAGATYKINGRNYIVAHLGYGSRAPQISNAYVNARIKDEAVSNLKSETFLSADLSYTWNYSKFRGSITGFWTELWNSMSQRFFYDYDLATMMTYTLAGVQTEHKGVEVGLEYKILNGLSVKATGAFARYNYKNNPTGVRSAQNGAMEDVERVTYLKNYYVGGTPQQAYGLAVNYAAPKNWFFEVNANYFCDGYVDLAPTRHEALPGLWKFCTTVEEYEQRLAEFAAQDKLKDAFVMNLSIGKLIYTKFGALNFNLSINNLLNNRNIQTGGFQESKLDYTNYSLSKFPNRYYYAQGIRVFFNFGIRF